MKHKVLAIAGIIIALLAVGFFYVRNTPYYSLYQLKRAVQNHDPDEALKYINIDSIVENLGKSFFGKKEAVRGQREGSTPSLHGLFAESMPSIKENLTASFRASIANPGHSNKNTNAKTATQPRHHTEPSVGNIELEGLDIKKLQETTLWDITVRADGKIAMISLNNNPGIRAKMIQTSAGHWQVVEIILSR
jgi:hypothetical protein